MKGNNLVWLLFLFAGIGQGGRTQPLDSLIRYLKEEHPAVRYHLSQIQAYQLRAPTEGLLPEPLIGVDYFPPQIMPPQFMIEQTIPPIHQLHFKREFTATQAKAQQHLKTYTIQTLLRRFYHLLADLYLYSQWKRLDSLAQVQLQFYKELLYDEFQAGKARASQPYEVAIQLSKLREAYAADTIQIQLKRQQLTALFNGHFTFSHFQIDTLPPLKVSLSNQIHANSLLSYYDREREKFQFQARIEESQRIPRLSVGGRYFWLRPHEKGNGKDALLFPSIKIQVPLYQGFYKERAQSARLQAEAMAQEQEKRKWELLEQWETANQTLSLLSTQWNELEYRIQNYALLLDLIYEEYSAGKIPYEEFLRIYLDWIQSQKEQVKLQSEIYKTKVDIAYLNQELE